MMLRYRGAPAGSKRWAVPPAPRDPLAATLRAGPPMRAPDQVLEALALDDYKPWLATSAAEPLQVAWSEERRAVVEAIFNEIRARYVWVADGPGDPWRRLARRLRRVGGRYVKFYTGDCDNFALELLCQLVNHPSGLFPRGCLRLAACKVGKVDHLVLTIETDCGSLILCNLAGLAWKGGRGVAGYVWICRELIGGLLSGAPAWERLEPPTLEDLARRHGVGA